MARYRNAACPCGSGRKYKNCCASRAKHRFPRTGPLVVLAVVVAVGVAGAAFISALRVGVPEGKVWSAEHRHWHDDGQVSVDNPSGELVPQPPGLAPVGKVWSPEHGHWHDLIPGTTNAPAPPPPGPAPEGKVWSNRHGHWHDLS